MQLFIGAQEGFLNHVLGVLFIASHTKGETEDCLAMPFNKDTKGVLVAFACLISGV